MTFRKILSPVDFSPTSDRSVRKAHELAKEVGATLEIVHVLAEPALALAGVGSYLTPTIVENYERTMRDSLDKLIASLDQSVPMTGRLLRGAPHEAIVEAAAKDGADLIVMGTHGRTGLPHMLLGSVTERVVRTSPVPVLTMRLP